ncbi:hypothetical protein B0O80DRAFT_462614 [Mortierella sp. GBAus27b]|nr:hypothetical protein BGX31_002243 [Mortierella sp. GBA43]KAI8348571.1 hypothetical protein B0O80DRAFT_462614 [Mortierella sp. GBAus27b]
MSKQVSRNRRVGALVAYTTLACSLVSLGVYVYRQQKGARRAGDRSPGNSTRNGASQDRNPRAGLDYSSINSSSGLEEGRTSEAQSSSLSRLGSKIARTVKRNKKVLTISLKNTIVWNPSPDPTAPNYGFVEGAIPLLFHLAENFNVHLILLCPPLQQNQTQANGKDRVPTTQEQEELKQEQQQRQEHDREQILTMLKNAGLITSPGARGPKLIDPRQLLICETEEGVSHVVRHLESQVHVEALQGVLEMVQGVVPRVVFVQKRPGHSRASSNVSGQLDDVMTRSHVRVRSTSRSSSSGSGTGFGSEDPSFSGAMGDGYGSPSSSMMGESFVEVIKAAPSAQPLVSGFVTQAGKKGYVEVTDQLMRSSLNPEFKE